MFIWHNILLNAKKYCWHLLCHFFMTPSKRTFHWKGNISLTVINTHFRDTFHTSSIQPNSTSLWTRFMHYILFILLSMAQAHATYGGKLRKCGLEGMGWFLSDLLHELSPCVLPNGQGTLVVPQAHGEGLVPKISTSKELLCSRWLWPKVSTLT